ncbi:unnamed protein product [Psylliodes chrysocephalus]|uniref:Uncharacterized protein n=1 Tax=Psylliodes chrysocephalus TaxID=3402493 RepID=A0A9P0DF24_9CUCU|nr:unnamed protein product [Psylliodes chrysocephala]
MTIEKMHRLYSKEVPNPSKIAVIAAVTNPRFKMRWLSAFKDNNVQVTSKDIQSWISSIVLAFKVSVEPDLTAQEDLEDVFFYFKDNPSFGRRPVPDHTTLLTNDFKGHEHYISSILNNAVQSPLMMELYSFKVSFKYNCCEQLYIKLFENNEEPIVLSIQQSKA